MKLYKEDVKTSEVLEWKGVHLLHFSGSSCSQKTRIVLNLKAVQWTSHTINLLKAENYSEWYLGINPRGLVPTLVHDGDVHIESNDIIKYLDDTFETPKLIANHQKDAVSDDLMHEDQLHLDLRTLTFGFAIPQFLAGKSPEALNTLEVNEGTVHGTIDTHKNIQLAFWRGFAKSGITSEQATLSANRFKEALTRFDQQLADQPYLLGDDLSMLDIAWFVYAHRLQSTGYPLERLHPRLAAWYKTLHAKPEFAKEVVDPFPLRVIRFLTQRYQALTNTTLEKVTGI